jgi:hypothetical protein
MAIAEHPRGLTQSTWLGRPIALGSPLAPLDKGGGDSRGDLATYSSLGQCASTHPHKLPMLVQDCFPATQENQPVAEREGLGTGQTGGRVLRSSPENWLRAMLGAAIALGTFGTVPAWAQAPHALTLDQGFTPNPTVLQGTGGGDHPAADVVGVRNTPTGLCLGYIDRAPHERLTLESRFDHLELRVESRLDTTLIVSGPGGVWCNDDSDGHNPAISGEWLPGDYRIWVGAYRADEEPSYRLYIEDLDR